MSQQVSKYASQSCLYNQIKGVDGVTEVWMFDLAEHGVGAFIVGGSDEDISNAFAMHTYRWNRHWYVGDTEYKREFFTAKWYRDYNAFQNKYKELSGVDYDFRATEEETIIFT